MLYAVLHRVLRVVLRVVWRPEVVGLEHLPEAGAVLVASNHLSFIDSIVIPLVVPRRVSFLAKAEYFQGSDLRGAPARAWFRAMGAVPVPRDAQRDARAALNAALEVLARGEAFGIYPEGTRSRDGRLYRGRTGVAWLSLTSGAPVVPVGVQGTDRMLPIGSRLPRPARVRVRFGPPVRPQAYAGARSAAQARRRLTDDVMDAVAALSGQVRAPGYNERPPED